MSIFDQFSIKARLIASYILPIIASIGLGYISLYTIIVNNQVATSVHTTLNERYIRAHKVSAAVLLLFLPLIGKGSYLYITFLVQQV